MASTDPSGGWTLYLCCMKDRTGKGIQRCLYYKFVLQIFNVFSCVRRTFSDQPCESVHNQKTRLLFFEAETDFWFVMVCGSNNYTKVYHTYWNQADDIVSKKVQESRLK